MRQRVIERIDWLADNVENIRHEVLTGKLSGLYKLRIGEYRVVYEILHDELSPAYRSLLAAFCLFPSDALPLRTPAP